MKPNYFFLSTAGPVQPLFFLFLLFSTTQGLAQTCTPSFIVSCNRDSIVHDGKFRKFIMYEPDSYDGTVAYPLVISLHGGSGNMVNAQGFSRLNPWANTKGYLVAWPQGYATVVSPLGNGYTWADGRNTNADQAGIDDVGFLLNLVDSLKEQYNIDTNRVYLCGFSNGGFMVQRMACQAPERF
ncbi:MAG: alpha/beta hydrolase family esterase, partial [Sphingobacteriia bacterium]